MTGNRAFLIVQSAVCALAAGLMAHAAVSLCLDGLAAQAGGDLFCYFYTREKVAAKLLPILPLIFLGLGMTLSGRILGIHDENAEKPVPIPLPVAAVPRDGGKATLALRLAFVALAAALIIAGIQNGGMEDVLTKANAICMECVGLG